MNLKGKSMFRGSWKLGEVCFCPPHRPEPGFRGVLVHKNYFLCICFVSGFVSGSGVDTVGFEGSTLWWLDSRPFDMEAGTNRKKRNEKAVLLTVLKTIVLKCLDYWRESAYSESGDGPKTPPPYGKNCEVSRQSPPYPLYARCQFGKPFWFKVGRFRGGAGG